MVRLMRQSKREVGVREVMEMFRLIVPLVAKIDPIRHRILRRLSMSRATTVHGLGMAKTERSEPVVVDVLMYPTRGDPAIHGEDLRCSNPACETAQVFACSLAFDHAEDMQPAKISFCGSLSARGQCSAATFSPRVLTLQPQSFYLRLKC